ncbi:hypothetical protein Tco_0065666 [Tanacetum coccineum]
MVCMTDILSHSHAPNIVLSPFPNDRFFIGSDVGGRNVLVHVSYNCKVFAPLDKSNATIMETLYFEKKFSDTPINSATQLTQIHEDSPSTSLIIIDEHEAPPIVTTSDEQTSPISLTEADEFNQEDSADFDGNSQFVPYNSLRHEEIESSTTALKPSNV